MTPKRSLFSPFIIIVLIGTSVFFYLKSNADDWLTTLIRSKSDLLFVDSGFHLNLDEARWLDGVGVELRNVRLIDQEQFGCILKIDSLVVAIDADFKDWVSRTMRPSRLKISGMQIRLRHDMLEDQTLLDRIRFVVSKNPPGNLVPVQIQESNLMWLNEGGQPATLLNFEWDSIVSENKELQIHLKGSSELVSAVDCKIKLDTNQKSIYTDFDSLVFNLNDRLLKLIPDSIFEAKSKFKELRGNVGLVGYFQYKLGESPEFSFNGRGVGIGIGSQEIPILIDNTSVEFSLDQGRLAINRLRGRSNRGEFNLNYDQRGWNSRRSWELGGEVENGLFDSELVGVLPDYCKKFCRDFSPRGRFDLNFNLHSSGRKRISSKIKDMAFSFYKFPFRIEHCVGNVNWINDRLNFEVSALEKDQLVEFHGTVSNPGKMATYKMHFGTDGRLPIDDKLYGSLVNYSSVDRAVRAFRPNGFVSGRGIVEKTIPGSNAINREVDIQLHDCSVRHKNFDYPIHDVNGMVRVDSRGFQFEGVNGRSGAGRVDCGGNWNPKNGLRLEFTCQGIDLDDRLRNALSPALRTVWDGIRPAGKLGRGRVFLDYPLGARGVDVRLQTELSKTASDSNAVRILPKWFPYALDGVRGDVTIGGGKVRLSGITARHGDVWINCDGTGRYTEHDWELKLENLLAGNVEPEHDLLTALPRELSEAIKQIQYEGQANISGEMRFAGDYQSWDQSKPNEIRPVSFESPIASDSSDIEINWDLRVDMDQASMQIGLPVKNIFGSVNLNGENHGGSSNCRGEVSIDSLTIHGIQITNIQGPIWIDNRQTLAGKFTNQNGPSSSLVGTVCDGLVKFDGWVSHEDRYPFYFKTTVEESQLDELASDFTESTQDIAGTTFGIVQMNGNANEWHSYVGKGNVHLRNAKIQELPIILSLLKILSIKEVNRTAFDSSNIDFSIEGNQLKFDRIELIGDAISLIGNGYLEIMRHADINFYSVVGRNRIYIPVVSDLYRAGSQRIMWINIGGPLENLQTTRIMLPGLDDSIKALLKSGENGNR